MKTIGLGVMLMILAVGCQNASLSSHQEGKTAAGREKTGMTKTDSKTAKPPLDLAAPARTATATFALG